MEKNWIKIFTTTDFFKAEMIRQALAEHDIHAVLINKQDSSYRFGQIELFSHESNDETARQIINEMLEDSE